MDSFFVAATFDAEAEKKVNELIKYAAEITKNDFMLQKNMPAHISLGSFVSDNEAEMLSAIESNLHKFRRGKIQLTDIGSFGISTIYLAPKKSQYLIDINRIVEDIIPSSVQRATDGDYEPERWTPHCSLAVELTESGNFIEMLNKKFTPITAEVSNIIMFEDFKIRKSWQIP